VDLALLEPDFAAAVRQLPATVHTLTEHQRLVCQHAVDTLNDMLDVAKMEHGTYLPKVKTMGCAWLCYPSGYWFDYAIAYVIFLRVSNLHTDFYSVFY
jgi:hypothetical protein